MEAPAGLCEDALRLFTKVHVRKTSDNGCTLKKEQLKVVIKTNFFLMRTVAYFFLAEAIMFKHKKT